MAKLISVELGKGEWVHAMVEGDNKTLCGKTKNIRGSEEDHVTCMKCLEKCKWMPVEQGAK